MIDTAAIPPGGEGKIEVTLDTKGKKGTLEKAIKITSNDPHNRTTAIQVRAEIELDFDFESASLYLGKLSADTQIIKSAFICVKDIDEIEIGEIQTNNPLLAVRALGFRQVEGQSARFELEITAGPGFSEGQFHGTVRVHSNLARKPVTELKVWGTVPSGVEVAPKALNYRMRQKTNSEGAKTKVIRITNYTKDLPLEILEIRDLDDRLELKLVVKKVGRELEITATLKSEEAPPEGHYSGRIEITTNNPQYAELIVPYSAVWQE